MVTFSQPQALLKDFLAIQPRKPLIVVVGPTASGKTAFSIRLAKELKDRFDRAAEVVNADSRQFYRGLTIGTAKITSEEMQGVPHHLIDVLDPSEPSTISWYKKEAERVIGEIHARGNIPMLVGGSMLYVSAVIDGLEPLPTADPKLREKLMKEYDADGGITLFRRLQEIDPETAASFPMQNKVYVVRAMEIFESTGKTKSSQKKMSGSPYDLLMFGMDRPMEELKAAINERTKQMLEHGWIEEVRALKEKGITMNDPAMRSIGYAEIFGSLDAISISELEETIASKTRAYAKRALTWWKRDPRIHWLTPYSPQA